MKGIFFFFRPARHQYCLALRKDISTSLISVVALYVQASMELGVSLSVTVNVQASMELGPEDVFLLERCPHFRECYVHISMELGMCPY